jgi:hypothetical protein
MLPTARSVTRSRTTWLRRGVEFFCLACVLTEAIKDRPIAFPPGRSKTGYDQVVDRQFHERGCKLMQPVAFSISERDSRT